MVSIIPSLLVICHVVPCLSNDFFLGGKPSSEESAFWKAPGGTQLGGVAATRCPPPQPKSAEVSGQPPPGPPPGPSQGLLPGPSPSPTILPIPGTENGSPLSGSGQTNDGSDVPQSSGFWPDSNFVFHLRKKEGGAWPTDGVSGGNGGFNGGDGGGGVGGGTGGGGGEQAILIHRSEGGDYKYNGGMGPPSEVKTGGAAPTPDPQHPTLIPSLPETEVRPTVGQPEPVAPGTAEQLGRALMESSIFGLMFSAPQLTQDQQGQKMLAMLRKSTHHGAPLPIPRREDSYSFNGRTTK